jgi:hypothetical protein
MATMTTIVQCRIPYDEAPPIFTAQQYDRLNQKWEAIKPVIDKHDPKFVLETQLQIDTFRHKLLIGEDIEIFQEIDKTIDGMTNSIKQINLNNRNKALEFKVIQLKNVQNESSPSPIAISPDTMFIITAKTLSGQIIPLECNGLMTIIEIKKLLNNVIDDPPDQIRIIFKGKQLEDKNLVKDYGICLGDSIHIIIRLRGGMFHISTDARDGDHSGEMNSVRINCRYYERGIWSLNYPANFTSVELRSEIVKTVIKEHIKLPINFTIDVTNIDDITYRFSRDDTTKYLGKMKSVTIRF